jgi:hypothetical protein
MYIRGLSNPGKIFQISIINLTYLNYEKTWVLFPGQLSIYCL